ncbi:MAG: Coenzyme F420 hydrogenase/dehydrogenase, beta subunit C-terminal domain [Deltaproteobacteria bacterium]|nr:Coenzyme F420 hydrogenase/dehydrogenase, beta subunit C-terminal domain [Deltaproteobacteria bacterium]
MSALKTLLKEVIDPGLCVACGACVSLCPYLVFLDGKVVCTDVCEREQGRCYEVCPKVPMKLSNGTVPPLGRFQSVHRTRATVDPWKQTGQYGGTVSAIIDCALHEGIISRAVLTSKEGIGGPHGVVAVTREEVSACGGSRYVAGGSLSVFNREAQRSAAPTGLVALPCQAMALNKMRASALTKKEHSASISLIVWLFCTWALDYRSFIRFLKREEVGPEIRKYDIPPPPANVLQIARSDAIREFPLDRIRPMAMEGCGLCPDMTAEQADISVGALEGDVGWNTAIVRTELGRELLERASDRGVVEVAEMPSSNLSHLEEASVAKRARGLARQRDRMNRD